LTPERLHQRGLTLTEILIVIGISGVLLGLAAAVLGPVRSAAQSAQCASNLRQMGIAAQHYALTYQYFPPAVRYENNNGFQTIAWDWVTSGMGASAQLISPGTLWQYGDDPDHVQQCPAYHGPSNTSADPFTGYNYNTTFLGGETMFPETGWEAWRPGLTYAACKRAEQCAMFGDGGYRNGANKYMRAPLNSEGVGLATVYSGGQAFRHNGSTNVVYIDGHIGSTDAPREGHLATAQLLTNYLRFPHNGFLSDDDSAYNPR
jgi:prepilin-type N-terminal cleavage/methylation domain-containing protein/prepilin-type processing-associated H-X9-DG protein